MYSSEEKPRRRRTASFSSSLLDAVYRSIDDSNPDDLHHRRQKEEEEEQVPKETLTPLTTRKKKKKQSKIDKDDHHNTRDKDLEKLRREMMIDRWVQKLGGAHTSSASSSSESLWSSSETESRPNHSNPNPNPKNLAAHTQSPKPSNGFSKTKLRALKIYGELKKVKQPISPGGRITSFLSSIFSSGHVKKPKMCYVGAVEDVTVTSARSCLVKPRPCSRIDDKRSVRFYPVSVIVGEDSKPCGHKRVCNDDDEALDPRLMASSDLRSFVRNKKNKEMEMVIGSIGRFCEEEEASDDEESCSSSDLFEIDHLVGVGLRYSEELPVYETTSLKAIAHHGFVYN